MIERRDEELSHIYRDAEGPRPPQRVDDNILAASQRVAGTVRRRAGVGFPRRWGTPVTLAATALGAFTLALMVFEREAGLATIAPTPPRAAGAGRPARLRRSTANPTGAVAGGCGAGGRRTFAVRSNAPGPGRRRCERGPSRGFRSQ